MNEIKRMLDSAVAVEDSPVDPAADIARGRSALRRRRMTRLGAGATGLAVVAVVSGVLNMSGGSSTPQPVATATTAAVPTDDATLSGIRLVAYTGEQVPGYKVGFVPEGWEIQGGDNTVLVLAAKGFKNQDTNNWEGKIAVQLASKDAVPEDEPITDEDLEAWGMTREEFGNPVSSAVTVNGAPGVITRNETSKTSPTVSLSFANARGQNLIVQGPTSLNWNDAQWVEFAEGVEVLKNAEAGVG